MAAVGIVGLAIGSAANLRTVLLSVRQRYQHFSDNKKQFNDLVERIERIAENLREIEQRMDSRSHADSSGHVDRQLQTVSTKLQACREVLEKLGEGPMQARSGPSYAHMSGACSQIASAARIHEKLEKVSTSLRDIDGVLDRVALSVGISELSRIQGSAEGVDRRLGVCSVPILTHQEILDFDGKDEDGNLTPESLLKMHVLDKQSNKVVAATGDRSSRPNSKVQSVHGMAGVGKTVALKGLGWDKDIREAFGEVHYITLGHDATDDAVVSELARIVEMSGGDRQSCTVRGCKDVSEAVSHTCKWFHGRKCLFLVDDMWKTGSKKYGYLPALRQLLSTCEGSRMAITTRDRNIAGEAGQAVEFGSRGAATSRKIFLSYFGSDALDAPSGEGSADESIEKILSICNGVPLVLGVAGRGARAMKEVGRSAADALDAYTDILGQQQANILDESAPNYGKENESRTLRAATEISLEHLNRSCKSSGVEYGMGVAEMYRALGVLKAQAWAPLSMLSKLWNVNRGDATRLMEQLCTMSLATWEDGKYKTFSSNVERRESGLKIHDLQLEYCRQHCKEMRSLHGKLLDRYIEVAVEESRTQASDTDGGRDGTEDALLDVEPRPWWSASVAEDGYVHANVAWHLVKAGKRDELRGLLVDARWIKVRLVIGGIVALENDFAELVRIVGADVGGEASATEWSDREFQAILNALRCSWHYVVKNERELAVQLGGRLFDVQESSAAAMKLVESAVSNSERPFAEARYGFLADARSGQVNEVHLGGNCYSLSYSSCGKYIAVAVLSDVVVVEADTLSEKMRFNGHTVHVWSVCFLPESLKIVSGSYDGTVCLWDCNKPDDDAITLNEHTDTVRSICASADGSRVASGFDDGTVRLWNLQEEVSNGEQTRRRSKWMSWLCCSADDTNGSEEDDNAAYGCWILRAHTEDVISVCFSPNGALLASASWDGTVRLWNAHTGKHTGVSLEVHEGGVLRVAFSPDGERIASGSRVGTIRLWRADTGAPTGVVIDGHSGWVRYVAFSADGARIVSASDDKTVRVWSAESGAAIGAPLKGHTDEVNSAVFSPDGARLASVSADRTLRTWEPEKAGGVGAAREGNSRSAKCASISADGSRIAVGYIDGSICILDTQSGRAVGGPLKGHTDTVKCVAFSTDGALLASGSLDTTVRLWDTRSWKAVGGPLEGHTNLVKCLAFSADGALLASGSLDTTVRLWDTRSWKAVGGHLEGHTDLVESLAFSADGALLASGSWDKTVRLWNVRTGAAEGGALEGHERPVKEVLLSADGTKLLSRSLLDNCSCMWSVASGTLLWMSYRFSKDVANVLSDAEALKLMEAIESQSRPDASNETAVVYYDNTENAVKMKRDEGDVRLAPLPWPWDERTWMHIADRSEFVAVLRDGRPVCLKLHV